MGGMREHIHRLYGCHLIVCVQSLQVTSLRGRVTRHIDDTLWSFACSMVFTTSGCIPARGGSVMMTSGRPCSAINSSVRMSFMSPA